VRNCPTNVIVAGGIKVRSATFNSSGPGTMKRWNALSSYKERFRLNPEGGMIVEADDIILVVIIFFHN